MIQLYACKISQGATIDELLHGLFLNVSEKAMQWKQMPESKGKESITGVLLLQYALQENGLFSERLKMEIGSNGRPFLKNMDMDFNISHSAGLVICGICVSEDCAPVRIGVDCESYGQRTCASMHRIAQRWFSDLEKQKYADCPTEEKFLEIWTAKEAIAKYSGVGLSALSTTDSCAPSEGLCLRVYHFPDAVVSLCHSVAEQSPKEIIFSNFME